VDRPRNASSPFHLYISGGAAICLIWF
jgi:hypothetical protein